MSHELQYLRMEDHDIIPSCLSAEPHKPRDFLLHYMGCEQFYQREEYLGSLTTNQIQQVEAKLRRIKYLRDALAKDPEKGAYLVRHLTSSLTAWRATKEYEEGIWKIRRQRVQYFAINGMTQKDVVVATRTSGSSSSSGGDGRRTMATHPGEYNPDMDTNAYLIRFKNGRPVHDMQDSRFHEQYPSHRISIHDLIYGKEDPGLLNPPANCMNYIHLPANNLLWAKDFITRYLKHRPSPEISPPPPPTQMNGTGLSSNSYRLPLTEDVVPINGTMTRSILGQKYWKSQQQSSSVTGKYLRPMCEVVAVSAVPEDGQQGVALFMPYLHWDTARHQAQISQAVQSETERYRKEKLQEEQRLTGMRRLRHRGLQFLNANSRQPQSAWRLENRIPSNGPKHPATMTTSTAASTLGSGGGGDGSHNTANTAAAAAAAGVGNGAGARRGLATQPNPVKRTATGAFVNIMKRHHGRFNKIALLTIFKTDGKGRVLAGNPLGQVLFDAAMLYETMTTYREKSLLRKYLHQDPPLHPRRTLEQTNEWTLSLSWHASARDQVVHRATRPKQLDFHGGSEAATRLDAEPFTKEWMGRVRKVPRVMMIDQLWMWILDDQTVLTCFPDNGDLSENNHLPGLHRYIRDALMKSTQGYIKSALDVALLVLSEAQICKASLTMIMPQDAQLVMQIFRQAIRDVASKHSFGAEQYWEWARIFSRLAHTDVDNGLSDLIVPFLDIGKEGELQGQIKSVVRDLEIMLRITTEQKEVIEKFEKTMQQLASTRARAPVSGGSISVTGNPIIKPTAAAATNPVPDAEMLLDEIQGSIDDLEEMRRSADDISASLDYLISLKQQQVTVVQAWQSMKQGEDNQKQNVTLLVFTVVTVIFLPMSFISSVFGMNNKEIAGSDAPMTLATQFKWMFPLSFAIVAITYYTAFGSPGRIARDFFRSVTRRLGMYPSAFTTPRDLLSWSAFRDLFQGRAKQKAQEQAWNRRRSAQIARENQERRQGRMNHGTGGPTGGAGAGGGTTGTGGLMHHGTNTSFLFGGGTGGGVTESPVPTPATPAHVAGQSQQTGMLGIYQDMNAMAGTRRVRTPEQIV